MNNNFSKSLIENIPLGYACHKIIVDKEENPIDYEFIEINSTFEKFTGLKAEMIINKRATEVLPKEVKEKIDWINFYGKIALNGEKQEFKQYYKLSKRWCKVQVFSPKKYFFSLILTDITIHELTTTTTIKNKEEKKILLWQNKLQKLIVKILIDFLSVNKINKNEKINNLLANIGKFFKIDHTYLFLFSPGDLAISEMYKWNKNVSQSKDFPTDFLLTDCLWLVKQIINNQPLYISNIN